MPVWEAFVNTSFLVPVESDSDDGETISTDEFRFAVKELDGKPTLVIAEHPHFLGRPGSSVKVIQMTGAKVVQTLNPEVQLLIGYPEGGFGIPKDQMEWLRASIQPVD